jgi:hypothetical protein
MSGAAFGKSTPLLIGEKAFHRKHAVDQSERAENVEVFPQADRFSVARMQEPQQDRPNILNLKRPYLTTFPRISAITSRCWFSFLAELTKAVVPRAKDELSPPVPLITVGRGFSTGWALLSVTDRVDPRRIDSMLDQILFHAIGAAIPQTDVVFLGAAIVTVTLDRKPSVAVFLQPI